MDLRAQQNEMYVSYEFPSSIIENCMDNDEQKISRSNHSPALPLRAPLRGRPPVNLESRLDFFQKKWTGHCNKLRKQEERRLKKVSVEGDGMNASSFKE